MDASFDLRYNRFVILAANDQASGCSIDSSVRAMKELGQALNMDFFNRTLVFFLRKDEVFSMAAKQLKKGLEEGTWHTETLTFNNLVESKGDLERSWLIKAGDSWLKRYLPRETVSG
jgi:hypothetical protein